ncbi:hypothetical protein R5R35_005243 [Gryllus longicercus]|uniref:Ras-GEF domain-containing family member 1B n=1 Tax=Gryllus longicercus TaxID=2509291 RepID=A0AAN9VRG7_9ORTH
MDDEIQETVESILGKGVKVVDCEKKSCVREEEVLLVNGCPIALEGEDGAAIREALLHGTVPHCDLLNQILIRAGILRAPVRLETSLSVKSTVVTREEVTVARGGQVVDERSRETKEDNFYTSTTSEVWEPVGVVNPTAGGPAAAAAASSASSDSGASSRPTSNASTSTNDSAASGQQYYLPLSPNVFRARNGGPPPPPPPDPPGAGSGAGAGAGAGAGPGPGAGAARPQQYYPPTVLRGGAAFTPTSSDSLDSDELDCAAPVRNGLGKLSLAPEGGAAKNGHVVVPGVQTTTSAPTIFGTVASDQTPKDGSSRRSLPQTPQSAKGFSALLNGGAAGEHGSSAESVPEAGADDHSLVYRDGGNLVAGSLEALVRHMVPTAEYYPDRAYLFAFLLSSRLFIKPHELLGEVCAVCEAQQKLGERSPAAKERLGRFIPHLVQLLAEWTETFPYDFRDERVMAHVRSITQKCVTAEPGIRKEVSTLLQNLLHRLTTLEKYEEFLQRVNAEASTNSVENLSPVDVTELCPSPTLLAQQLTHIELERLSYIGPEEFVQAFAKDNPHLETSFKDMKKTRNLESYVQWFNRLSYFVATEVCKHVKKKQRVKVMEFWIEAARECFNIGNFNSLMAIIAGLNMSPISRLKKTWSKVQQAKFSILEHQMDPSSNFSSYRSTLKAAMWRSAGATDERQRIVIPFFSLLVKDIYFLNEGCSNKLPNGHINFEKFWQLAKQVTEFITWKQVTCPFEKNTKVITFLQASPVLTENALALASFECEPPENNHEKERYKSLKSELNS